jgi:hypothetical protein
MDSALKARPAEFQMKIKGEGAVGLYIPEKIRNQGLQ